MDAGLQEAFEWLAIHKKTNELVSKLTKTNENRVFMDEFEVSRITQNSEFLIQVFCCKWIH